MKKQTWLLLPLAVLLLLGCAACGSSTEPSGAPDAPDASVSEAGGSAEPSAPLALETLCVEFVAAGRGEEELLQLRGALPEALIAALKEESVEVGQVSVSFGTSAEATAAALESGAVQAGFLPAETFFAHEDRLRAAALENGGEPSPELCVLAVRAEEDERLVAALQSALPKLAPVLAHYVPGGDFTVDADALDALRQSIETAETTE